MGNNHSSTTRVHSAITDSSKTEMNRTITDQSITDISTTNTSIDNSVVNITTETNINNSITINRNMKLKIKKAIGSTVIQTDEGDLGVTQKIKSQGPKVKSDRTKDSSLQALAKLTKNSDVSGKSGAKKDLSAQASAPTAGGGGGNTIIIIIVIVVLLGGGGIMYMKMKKKK